MLDVENLHVRYGTVEAVKGLSFHVPAGSIVSLIGANGAGKTTSLRALTGLVRPGGGSLRFGSTSLIGLAPHEIVGLGIARKGWVEAHQVLNTRDAAAFSTFAQRRRREST